MRTGTSQPFDFVEHAAQFFAVVKYLTRNPNPNISNGLQRRRKITTTTHKQSVVSNNLVSNSTMYVHWQHRLSHPLSSQARSQMGHVPWKA